MAKSTIDAAAAAETVTQAATKGFEQTLASLKEGMAQAGSQFQSNFETTQAKVKENMDKAMKSAEEMVAFGQGNLDAFVKSAQIWTAGWQDLGKQAAASAQANFDASVAAFQAFGGAKSLKDAVDAQATFAKASLEKATTEAGKLTEASMKLAEQSFAPIVARVTLAAEKFAKPV